jgi:hypothetical protein
MYNDKNTKLLQGVDKQLNQRVRDRDNERKREREIERMRKDKESIIKT